MVSRYRILAIDVLSFASPALLRFTLAFQSQGLPHYFIINEASSPPPKVNYKANREPPGAGSCCLLRKSFRARDPGSAQNKSSPVRQEGGDGVPVARSPPGGTGPSRAPTRRDLRSSAPWPAPRSTVQPQRRAEAGSPGPRVRPCRA